MWYCGTVVLRYSWHGVDTSVAGLSCCMEQEAPDIVHAFTMPLTDVT